MTGEFKVIIEEINLQEVEQFIRGTLSQWNCPGLAVSVVKNNETVFCEGFGVRSLTEQAPVTRDTIFPIASSTKAFTALSIGILCEQGVLSWDTPVYQYIPHFKMYDPLATLQLTLRDMACHRTGLARHDLLWYRNSTLTRSQVVERLRHLEPNVDFRTKWQYSNLMYTALGHVIETVSGALWEDFVREHLFVRLEMNRTVTSNKQSQALGDFALPYREVNSELIELSFYPPDFEPTGPAGGIKSTASDLSKWLLFHLSNGKYGDTEVCTSGTIHEMQTPHIPCNLNPWESRNIPVQAYGLGWFIEPFHSKTVVHHGGHIDGFSSLVSFIPEIGVGVVVLANKNHVPVPEIVTRYIYDRYLGVEADWNEFYMEQQAQALELSQEKSATRKASKRSGTSPSHALESYAGSYFHPGYGTLNIAHEEDALYLQYNGFSFPLTHFHYDIFEFNYTPFQLIRNASFQTGTEGDIDSVSIQLEPTRGVSPITFRR